MKNSKPASKEIDELEFLLEDLYWGKAIEKPQTIVQASLVPANTLSVTYKIKMVNELTYKQYRKFRNRMLTRFPWLTIKKTYNYPEVVLSYTIEQ